MTDRDPLERLIGIIGNAHRLPGFAVLSTKFAVPTSNSLFTPYSHFSPKMLISEEKLPLMGLRTLKLQKNPCRFPCCNRGWHYDPAILLVRGQAVPICGSGGLL